MVDLFLKGEWFSLKALSNNGMQRAHSACLSCKACLLRFVRAEAEGQRYVL